MRVPYSLGGGGGQKRKNGTTFRGSRPQVEFTVLLPLLLLAMKMKQSRTMSPL